MFVKEGDIVLDPVFSSMTWTGSLLPIFEITEALQQRIKTLARFSTTEGERELRQLTIEISQDRLKTLWLVLGEEMDQAWPTTPNEAFNVTVYNKIRDMAIARENGNFTSSNRYYFNDTENIGSDWEMEVDHSDNLDVNLPASGIHILGLCQRYLRMIQKEDSRIGRVPLNATLTGVLEYLDDIYTGLLPILTAELEVFLQILQDIKSSKWSPLLFDTTSLQEAYRKIRKTGQRDGLNLISQDSQTLLKITRMECEINDMRLKIILKVPLISKRPTGLFRYTDLPWDINDHLFLRFVPDERFLVMDMSRQLVVGINDKIIQLCYNIDQLWICPNVLSLLKQPSESCIYHIFQQQPNEIERTCKILIEPARDETTPIAPNLYLISSKTPTTLSQDCGDTSPTTISIPRAYILALNTTCPKAATAKRSFQHQKLDLGKQILKHPITPVLRNWMENLFNGLESWLLDRNIRKNSNPVSLQQIQDDSRTYVWGEIIETLVYAMITVVPLLALIIMTDLAQRCIKYFKNKGMVTMVHIPQDRLREMAGNSVELMRLR